MHLLQTIFAKLNQSANPCMYAAIVPEMKIALWQVFHDAVHQLAVNHYSQAQLDAWRRSDRTGHSGVSAFRRSSPLSPLRQ
jgi:hypothetical protein